MTWAHPAVLALVPAALVAGWWMTRRLVGGDLSVFANIKRLWADRHGVSDRPVGGRAARVRGVFLAVGMAAALLALARPQWGEIPEQSYEQSREVMLAIDLSRSMLADDVAPNRLARAKLLVSSLLDELKGERVGLIVFAGTAFVQSPLSADYEVLRDFLDELDPSYLPQGGTNYEAMLNTAVQAFGQQGNGDRYLVVLSDGEALDENWKSLVPALRERGIRVVGLGVGTPEGALLPDGAGGLVKDEQGAAVLSRLEPRTLQDLASESGGTYRDAASWVDIAELVNATVEQGQRGEYVEERNLRLEDRYQWFLAPALLLLLLSYGFEFPVSPLARALPTRGRRTQPASAPVIAAALMGLAAWHSSPRLANAAVSDSLPSRSDTASQPNPLAATVAALSNREQLTAKDYAKLATATVAFASQPEAPTDATRGGIIDDALAAVDRGELSDPRAADWPALRQQLEQLKQIPEPPPQEQSQQNQQEQKQDEQQGQTGQQDQPQQGGSGAQNEPQQGQDSQAAQDHSGSGGKSESQKNEQKQQQAAKDGESSDQQDAAADAQHDKDADAPDQKSAADQPSPKDSHQPADSDQQKDSAQAAAGAAQDQPAQQEAQAEKEQTGTGEVKPQDQVQPVDAPEAGLADNQDRSQDENQPTAAAAAPESDKPAQQPPPSTRMVGGGRAVPESDMQHQGAMAAALSQMQHVKDGDAPAVLFDRMNRAEGQPRTAQNTKNW